MMSDLASGSLSSLIYLDLGRQRGVWLLTNTRQIAHSTTTLYMVKWPYIYVGDDLVYFLSRSCLVLLMIDCKSLNRDCHSYHLKWQRNSPNHWMTQVILAFNN